jgi:prepilin-type N-terminal cleavage/methylation domain-containing protein
MKKNRGFTIVELLVVIVVIGILATITIVSFTGVNQRAIVASVESDLDSNARLLKLYNSEYGTYPTAYNNNCPSLPTPDTKYCLKTSGNNSISGLNGSGSSFSICVSNGTTFYSITDNTAYTPGCTLVVSGGTVSYVDSSGLNPRSSPAYSGGYTIRTFTTIGSSTLSVSGGILSNVSVLVVGGGGGGGSWNNYAGGGGGGGQFLFLTNQTISGSSTVVVGSGGNGGSSSQGTDGQSSSFGSNIAAGGGGGGGGTAESNGRNGASGGGAAGWVNTGGIASAGYNGGNNYSINSWAAGGGGCGGVGGDAKVSPVTFGVGGVGLSSSISGSTTWYCGGGGGGSASGVNTSGGSGVGGNGDSTSNGAGANATANSGSGGGGGGVAGGNGSAGIVIVKYPN